MAGQALTIRQREYIKAKLDDPTRSNSEAAKLAGYQRNRQGGYRCGRSPAQTVGGRPLVQRAIERLYRKAGITDALLAQRAKEGLDAQYESRHSAVMLDDHKTRLGYLRLVHEVKGDLQDQPVQSQPIVLQIGFASGWDAVETGRVTVPVETEPSA